MTGRIAIVSGDPAGRRHPLRSIAHSYLESLLPRNGAGASLAPEFRASINGEWVANRPHPPIEDFPALQIFLDPVQGGVVVTGVAVSAGMRCPYALRLKVQGEQILEAESILSDSRKGHFADVDQMLEPDVLYDAPVPPERASDRAGLIAAADSYWAGLQESDGSIPRFSYRCERFDNGKKLTNNLSILLSPEATVLTCASSLNLTRAARPVARNRRFPVLDVDLGIVASFAVVDFQPNPQNGLPGMAYYALGLFKIVDGSIRSLDEISTKLPLGTAPIW